MPRDNARDLRDIPKKVLKVIRVCLVEHMDEVLRVALLLPNPDDFLVQPSQAVDWRVPVDQRRAERDRREDTKMPVASAVPPPSAVEPGGGDVIEPPNGPRSPEGTEH
jgi:hypothetical protein